VRISRLAFESSQLANRCNWIFAGMPQQAPLYIVASPRPRVGKTLIARLLLEFFRSSDRTVIGYDLDPREPTFAGYFPQLVSTVDIADTRGQMALFDRLVANTGAASIIDLGYGPFETFFAVMTEIGFVQEARRRSIEPVVLFVADPAPATVRAYAQVRRGLESIAFVPVHNEQVSVMYEKADFPPSRAEYNLIRIPRLTPIVRGVVDRPSFSFAEYMNQQLGGPTEVHQWIHEIFTGFRELELRLLMGRLTTSLGDAPSEPRAFGRAR
jgi:hypothetical protein